MFQKRTHEKNIQYQKKKKEIVNEKIWFLDEVNTPNEVTIQKNVCTLRAWLGSEIPGRPCKEGNVIGDRFCRVHQMKTNQSQWRRIRFPGTEARKKLFLWILLKKKPFNMMDNHLSHIVSIKSWE